MGKRRCYAAPIGGCSEGPLSLEHTMSAAILRHLNANKGLMVRSERFPD